MQLDQNGEIQGLSRCFVDLKHENTVSKWKNVPVFVYKFGYFAFCQNRSSLPSPGGGLLLLQSVLSAGKTLKKALSVKPFLVQTFFSVKTLVTEI